MGDSGIGAGGLMTSDSAIVAVGLAATGISAAEELSATAVAASAGDGCLSATTILPLTAVSAVGAADGMAASVDGETGASATTCRPFDEAIGATDAGATGAGGGISTGDAARGTGAGAGANAAGSAA